jgi:hypothetical protein
VFVDYGRLQEKEGSLRKRRYIKVLCVDSTGRVCSSSVRVKECTNALFVGIVYARLSGTPTCLGPEKKKGLKKRRYVEKYDCGQNLSQTKREKGS